jgi:DNA-binding transcriptional MerR regulator
MDKNSNQAQPVYGGDPSRSEPDAAPASVSGETISIGELARQAGVSLRALRFYHSRGLLTPHRAGHGWAFSSEDCERLDLILQGKRLGFTLMEIRDMLAARDRGSADALPVSRKKCVEQIRLLERQRREIEAALAELRRMYTDMYTARDSGDLRESPVGVC